MNPLLSSTVYNEDSKNRKEATQEKMTRKIYRYQKQDILTVLSLIYVRIMGNIFPQTQLTYTVSQCFWIQVPKQFHLFAVFI